MARIRTVKPDIWTDSDFVGLSALARLLFIGTWNHADDYGVLKDDPVQLKLQILPGDDCDPYALVEELVEGGFLLQKQAPDGTAVLVIRTFCMHQKIDKRSAGKWGEPDDFTDPPPPPPITRRAEPEPAPPAAPAPPPTDSPPVPTDPPESLRAPTDPAPGKEGRGLEGKGRENEPAPRRAEIELFTPPAADAADIEAAPASVHVIHPERQTQLAPTGRYPSDFEAWYELYPRKRAKAEAAAAWPRARSVAGWEEIIAGLRRSIAMWEREKTPPDKIPYPATWLNQRRWEDEPDAMLNTTTSAPKGAASLQRAAERRGLA